MSNIRHGTSDVTGTKVVYWLYGMHYAAGAAARKSRT